MYIKIKMSDDVGYREFKHISLVRFLVKFICSCYDETLVLHYQPLIKTPSHGKLLIPLSYGTSTLQMLRINPYSCMHGTHG